MKVKIQRKPKWGYWLGEYKKGCFIAQYSARSKELLDIQAITECRFTLNTYVI